ncbi:hypothetical protein V6x_28500 [Gimesia chilikensis]|uniref:Thioredoxin family protein n=1 Tax=Gimesia chilikensis TaxID=2605989 RepID=A0A517WD28_9PLAN|nr:hypothetical protein [Gimesia chilikensis]QDU03138.1 hypothetical protein V6x_28500 [Gimesia chilikensis]
MKTYLVLPVALVAIALLCLPESQTKAQNKSDRFEMPVTSSQPAGKAAPAKTDVKEQPVLYFLVMDNCAPCLRLKGEITARSDRARWLLNHYKTVIVTVNSVPAVMSSNGSQFKWPDECWKPDGSPLKALTDRLGYKAKESGKVGIRDLLKANADLVLSEFSGVAQPVVCTPQTGQPINTQGDFLEDDPEPLQFDDNAERQPRSAIIDLPRVVDGSALKPENGWRFTIDGETWSFNGFQGRDTNVQTVLLTMNGTTKNAGRVNRF